MRRYLIGRLSQFVAVVLAASVIVFLALYVAVDPIKTMLPVGASPESIEQMRSQLGLDRPIWAQYGSFLFDAVRGDFGTSQWLGTSAFEAAVSRIPATAMIALPATFLGVLLGVGTGVVASLRPSGWLDSLINVFSYLSISISEFWLGIMLMLIFAVHLGWFPTGGTAGYGALVLPVAVLAVRPFAHTAQLTRASMVEETAKEYVTTARSKGLSDQAVAIKHVLRNAAVPIITLATYDLSRLFVGTAIVVEVVFNWPGIGRLAVDALQQGDIFLVQAVVFVAAVITVGISIIADLLYFWLDPRTRSVLDEVRA